MKEETERCFFSYETVAGKEEDFVDFLANEGRHVRESKDKCEKIKPKREVKRSSSLQKALRQKSKKSQLLARIGTRRG